MSGDRHNPNVELVAQGVANIFSPLFGGLPATGAIARTATNIRSGAKTACGRNGPRAHASRDHDVCRAARSVYSAFGAGGDFVRGCLQHGGVARNSGIIEIVAPRNRNMGQLRFY